MILESAFAATVAGVAGDATSGCAHVALTLSLFLVVAVLLQRQQPKLKWTAPDKDENLPCKGADENHLETRELDADSEVMRLPSHPHLQGAFLPYSGELLYFPNEHNLAKDFENDMCHGRYFVIHRPTYDPALDRSGDYPCAEVFKGRKINWEMRIQLRFKKDTNDHVHMGVELDEYVPLMGTTKAAMSAVVSSLKWLIGNELHHSPGDDPKRTSGELERPIFSMPLFVADQFIETPEGEEPPSLIDPNFMQLGIRRADDSTTFTKTLSNKKFVSGRTYTFAVSRISQLVDVLSWKIGGGIPGWGIDFDNFCGRPPLHMAMYTLKSPPIGSENDQRHLDSRKNYLFHVACWSSERRPTRHRLEELMPDRLLADSCSKVQSPTAECSLSHRGAGLVSSSFMGLCGCFEGLGCIEKQTRKALHRYQENGAHIYAQAQQCMKDCTKVTNDAFDLTPLIMEDRLRVR